MNRRVQRVVALAGLLALTPAGAAQDASTPAPGPDAEESMAYARGLSNVFQRVARDAKAAVVHIERFERGVRRVGFRRYVKTDQLVQRGLGSGVIIDDRGHIITNNHVVADADDLKVTLADGRSFRAELVGRDESTDLAVLRVGVEESLPSVRFGNSDDMEVGEWVIAVGSPFGLQHSVTAGIVSAKGRPVSETRLDQYQRYEEFIQTDAAINPGNSGGPLLNLSGEVIGINTAILSRGGGNVGIGFAIPSRLASAVSSQLIEKGTFERGFLGITIGSDERGVPIESVATPFGPGVVISEVEPGGAAESAGIKPGDVILRFAGRRTETYKTLFSSIGLTPPGETVPIDVVRDGERADLRATLTTREQAQAAFYVKSGATYLADAGIVLMPAEREPGAVVVDVVAGSLAERMGLRAGDVIKGVNGRSVRDDDAAQRLIEGGSLDGGIRLALRRGRISGELELKR
ncbi:MAG: trypsin-like peptidase domain-containing protein [Planctomycetota bacterium]